MSREDFLTDAEWEEVIAEYDEWLNRLEAGRQAQQSLANHPRSELSVFI